MTVEVETLIDLSDQLDEALQPWTCPQCRQVYQPPLTIYISPIDGLERCTSCADGPQVATT